MKHKNDEQKSLASVVTKTRQPGEQFYPATLRWDAEIKTGTLTELLEDAVRQYGDRPAIEYCGRQIQYGLLQTLVDEAATAFLHHGFEKGQSIALLLGNSPHHPINFFGGLKAGARIVHLSPLDGDRARIHKLTDSGARVLVTTNRVSFLSMGIDFLKAKLIDLLVVCEEQQWDDGASDTAVIPRSEGIISFAEFVAAGVPPSRWPEVKKSDIALLQYTGGTTGPSKGAILTHENLVAAVSIFELWSTPSRQSADRVICVLPLFHIFALTVVLLLRVRLGDLISLHKGFDVEAVLRDISIDRATILPAVPTMWIAIANHENLLGYDLSSLTSCLSGGAPLPLEVARRLERITNLPLKNGWGMTETCSPGTHHPDGGPDKPESIGIMLPSLEIDVVALDNPARPLLQGEIGEIRIKGTSVTQGYWNRPEETAAAFFDGRFLTGDVGYMDSDGYFFLVDRKKDMIISGGLNVYPQLVEQVIYEHPAVMEVGVIGVPDDYWGETVKAFVKLRSRADPFTVVQLREFLAGKLGKHEMPTQLQFMDELPKTTVGKLSRQELRAVTISDKRSA